MTTQPPDERPALDTEHEGLKQQTAELRDEHNVFRGREAPRKSWERAPALKADIPIFYT